jgi:uncharacterized membrane protein YeaQ/YmgE (transglycosylase-associated protein family)
VPDTVSLIIWVIAGIAGGFAVRDILRMDFGLDPLQNALAGVVGGVIGVQILQRVIPHLQGLDIVPIVGQAIVAFASGAALTVVAGAVMRWRRRR